MLASLYLRPRLFILLAALVGLFFLSFAYRSWLGIAQSLFVALVAATVIDTFLLYRIKSGIFARRYTPDRLSNGDENELQLYLENFYPFAVSLDMVDEVPHQFQLRDVLFSEALAKDEHRTIRYFLRPTQRGEYSFGKTRVYVTSPLGLVSRRYQFGTPTLVPVYPSFIQMRKYELLAISNRLTEYGVKKIRRIGQSMEFEQIKNYVSGDDYRVINWRATARNNDLMVNQYQDERSQQVYNVIDKGRVMKMPFEQLTLLDYAINAALVISNIAIKKGDKAGLITFAEQVETVLKAQKEGGQMRQIQERLYRENTRFLESDYEKLYVTLRRVATQRSLILLYTNFESLSALRRQLPFLSRLGKQHLVVVIFFENTELRSLLQAPANNLETIYQKTIAEKFAFEKRLIVKELQRHGIQAILTPPQLLTVNTINKYLELKARGMI